MASPSDSADLNRYSYVRNGPIRSVDPTGHCVESATLGDDGSVARIVVMGSYAECTIDPSFQENSIGANEVQSYAAQQSAGIDHGVSLARDDVLDFANPPEPPLRSSNAPEMSWCLRNFNDCYEAFDIRDDSLAATKLATKEFGLSRESANAFRHVYWMALTTIKIGSNDARSLGRAHENGRSQGRLDSEIDLLNNAIGIALGERIGSLPGTIFDRPAVLSEPRREIADLVKDGGAWCAAPSGGRQVCS